MIELRRDNNFSGNAFRSRQILKIRIASSKFVIIVPQVETDEVKTQKFKNITGEEIEECKYYLNENCWDLKRALDAWQEDVNFIEHNCR